MVAKDLEEIINMFRNRTYVQKTIKKIEKITAGQEFRFMHVCGTHEQTLARFGLRKILPKNIKLLAGPGCPVCVTLDSEIDEAVELAKQGKVILTFGDMIRVPGSKESLHDVKAKGCDVRIIYGAMDAVKVASKEKEKEFVFFSIGFETTAPMIASVIRKLSLRNFSILTCNKLIPPAMEALLEMGEVNIQGFINPGHVSTIIGSNAYLHISKKYNVPQVITGFEPVDILVAILMLINQIKEKRAHVENEYSRVVTKEGNTLALEALNTVFEPDDAGWRGLAVIPKSGLKLREKYKNFDARKKYNIRFEWKVAKKGCKCGEILRGLIDPYQCPLFKKICTPTTPVGPCMVSNEGTCNITFKYG
jgi:hydrogenase expression/formation protein HypD